MNEGRKAYIFNLPYYGIIVYWAVTTPPADTGLDVCVDRADYVLEPPAVARV